MSNQRDKKADFFRKNGLSNNRNSASPQERGARLRYIRKELLQISRSAFEARYKDLKITEASLQNWEDARYKGLREEHADRLLIAFKKEGLICDKYWLLEGIGQPPTFTAFENFITPGHNTPENESRFSETELVTRELQTFHEYYSEATSAIVSDEGLAPWFCPGDYVAGVRYAGKEIKKVIGLPCIVQTLSGEILIRKIEQGDGDTFNLIPTNTKFKVHKNVPLYSAAPIIWWRKLLSSIED